MTYVFDNAAPQAQARLAALAEVHDDGTIRHLLARGVGDGWKCLEIGGGPGTITRWLSDRVGAHGYVLTTDIDTRFLAAIGRDNVEVRQHDILVDPLPEATFDLAYARLVLEHLWPARAAPGWRWRRLPSARSSAVPSAHCCSRRSRRRSRLSRRGSKRPTTPR